MYLKCLILVGLISVLEAIDPLSDEFIAFLNSKPGTWKAGRNFDKDTPMRFIKVLMGITYPEYKYYSLLTRIHRLKDTADLPVEFDPRQKWPFCPSLNEIRDQGFCGSCWAFASVEVMTDRTCIHSKGQKNFHYSAEDVVSCCGSCGFGCQGGFITNTFKHWKYRGFVSGGNYNSSEGCLPYKIAPCEHFVKGIRPNCTYKSIPGCKRKCESNYKTSYDQDLHLASDVYNVDPKSLMKELVENGPVAAVFEVYEDFIHYKSGVYQHKAGPPIGGHAIRILGYGVEDGVPYWLCANSWNTDWGDGGFFKILRGKNECGIEEYLVTGIPELERFSQIEYII